MRDIQKTENMEEPAGMGASVHTEFLIPDSNIGVVGDSDTGLGNELTQAYYSMKHRGKKNAGECLDIFTIGLDIFEDFHPGVLHGLKVPPGTKKAAEYSTKEHISNQGGPEVININLEVFENTNLK
jgi:hypothetical protein